MKSAFADKEDHEASAASRPFFWSVAVRLVEDNPLGIGIKCYQSHYDCYNPTGGEWGCGRAVHSSHFEVLAEPMDTLA